MGLEIKSKVHDILQNEDGFIPPEWVIYSKSNTAIKIVKNEIDEILKQLKIAVKTGDFDDYFEREAPALYQKLNQKKEELITLLHYERTKEKRKEVYKVDVKSFTEVPVSPLSTQEVHSPKTIEERISLLSKVSRSYSDTNLYIAGVLGIILVVVQLLFNFTFEMRLKNNIQSTVVQNLENRLRLAENRNLNLSQSLTHLRKSAVETAAVHSAKNTVAVKPNLQKRKISSKTVSTHIVKRSTLVGPSSKAKRKSVSSTRYSKRN